MISTSNDPVCIDVDVNQFDGLLFNVVDEYKADMLSAAEDLRRRVAGSRALGDLLTGDVLARGRSAIQSLDVRNQNPTYPPVFLTYLENRNWIAWTDHALDRMKKALIGTPKVYRRFVKDAADQSMGGLFELNVYGRLDEAFPPAEPQPKLTGSNRRGDIRIVVGGVSIFIEATAIGEGSYWNGISKMMQDQGRQTWVGAAPGPAHDARRIVSKIAEELSQTAPDAPNIIAISFFGNFPSEVARQVAWPDLFAGGPKYGGTRDDGTLIDLSFLPRVDAVLEFSRNRLVQVHVNPTCNPTFRLSDTVRATVKGAFEGGRLMIR